jgi:hypothetical protein
MTRRRLVVAALLGCAIAVIVIGASSRFDVDRMTFGDGVLHRYVAEHLTAPAERVTKDLGGHGTAIRYSRVGLPALLWTFSAGNRDAMRYAQPLLMVIAAAAAAAAAQALLPRVPFAGAVPFAGIGLTLSLAGGFAEPIGVACALWAVVAARRARYWSAAVLLAAAMLTRENAVGILLGLMLWELVHRRVRPAFVMASSVLPVAVWHLLVAARFGFLPLRDPFLVSQSEATGVPGIGLWRSLTHLGSASVLVIVVHIVLGIAALTLWRANDLGAAAALSALQLLVAGLDTWRFVGDALRLMSFLEVFLVMAFVARMEERPVEGALRGGRDARPEAAS